MIFGNHSLTQYPCINTLRLKGVNAKEKIPQEWLEQDYIKNVQNRGG
jgi:malate/lactate dehydrogenase